MPRHADTRLMFTPRADADADFMPTMLATIMLIAHMSDDYFDAVAYAQIFSATMLLIDV